MDNQIQTVSNKLTMSSREIAELTSKNKSDVHVDIWNMLQQLYGTEKDDGKTHHYKNQQVAITDGVTAYFDNRGYISVFLLDRRHTEILITGYDVKRRAAIIDRWHALETGEAEPRITALPTQQQISMNHDILSLARVVAEATASATMKAVIDIVGIQKPQPAEPIAAIVAPLQSSPDWQVSHQASDIDQSEYVPVADLAWTCGLSDAACRRLVAFSNLPTRLTNGEHGYLLIHRESFIAAAQALLDSSTPPSGKIKRWQHPEFGGFTLRLKSDKGEHDDHEN